MENDYSKLEGKEVRFIKSDGLEEILVVAGCDQSIGLTLYAKDDKNRNVICLTGPLSPVKKAGKGAGWDTEEEGILVYNAMFSSVVDGIKHGVINSEYILRVKNDAGKSDCSFNDISDMECAFSQ